MESEVVSQPVNIHAIAEVVGLTKGSDRNRARLFLAAVSFVNLSRTQLSESEPLTRTQLFYVPDKGLLAYPSVSKEASSKKWQSDFIEMLVKSELVTVHELESGGIAFTYGDKGTFSRALFAILDGDITFLKMLLWPADYGAPTVKDFKNAEAAIEARAGQAAETPADDSGFDVIEKVAANLKGVADHLGQLYQSASKQSDDLKYVTDSILELSVTLSALDKKFDTVVSRIDTAVQKLEKVADDRDREEREALRDLITKMGESDARKKSLLNQLEGESRRLELMIRAAEQKLGGT